MIRSHRRHSWIILLVGLAAVGCRSDVKVDRGRDTASGAADTRADSTGRHDSITVPGEFIDATGETAPEDSMPAQVPASSRNITVATPTADSKISGNALTLKGTARTFENGLSYRLTAGNGSVLAQGHTMSHGDMGHFNPYSVRVTWASGFSGRALLEVFQSSAKDGSEVDKVSIPLVIAEGAGTDESTLRLFYTNAAQGTAGDCRKVFPVTRRVPHTVAVAEAALRALLEGPTDEERRSGYGTEIPAGTRLRQIAIADGHITADFSSELGHIAGSCSVTAARAEIEQTLRQFPTVSSVTITINGSAKEALQP